MEWQIYQLLDPRDRQPRYVGITQHPLAVRYAQHVTGKRCACAPWIRELRSLSLKPLMRRLALFDGTKAEAEDVERAWIDLVESKFATRPLLNIRRSTRGVNASRVGHAEKVRTATAQATERRKAGCQNSRAV